MAAWNCAVAVKSGNDVILLDVCGPSVKATTRKPIFTIKMYLNGELTPGTEVISHGGGLNIKSFRIRLNFREKPTNENVWRVNIQFINISFDQVVLPTGARNFVMAGQIIGNRQFLNVKMVASTFDFNQTEEKTFYLLCFYSH